MRVEKDSMGEKKVPDEAYYGIHTLRSLENFDVCGEPLPIEIIYAITKLKLACARANLKLGLLDSKKEKAIEFACKQVLSGKYDTEFPIDVFQAGSGTSSNMNVNEVLANIAAEKLGGKRGDRKTVHPNDDVNKGQSTNNIMPSGIRVACVELSEAVVIDALYLLKMLRKKEKEFASVIKSGRTHLQDAVPITVGQEFGAYARAVEKGIYRVDQARSKILELGVGGNAVGTGLNTKSSFRKAIIKELNKLTKEKYVVARHGVEATQFLTDLGELSSALSLLATDLVKIVNDLRLLSSGPNTAIGEILLPAVEPGSSIMPGKINPSICEAANMACMQIIGNHHAVSIACGAGQFELNTHMPLIGYNVVKSLKIMKRCCVMLADKCVKGIKVNNDKCRHNFEWSAGLATVLNPMLGYDRVSELVKESLKKKKNLKELVLEKKIMSEKEFEKLISGATRPNL